MKKRNDPIHGFRVRESWQATFGGSGNVNKIAVSEEGMKYTPISISPEQDQFLETMKFQINEIVVTAQQRMNLRKEKG